MMQGVGIGVLSVSGVQMRVFGVMGTFWLNIGKGRVMLGKQGMNTNSVDSYTTGT